MTMKTVVHTQTAPKAIGPYSQAVRVGEWLFLSGQIPIDPATGDLVQGDAAAQTQRVLDNIEAVLAAAAFTFEHVVKTTIFLADLGDFAKVNEVYGRRFPSEPPARSTVQVAALPRGARVEIEVTAFRNM
jgi:2-iminobutanoate/2-iminopropanoate deaminase